MRRFEDRHREVRFAQPAPGAAFPSPEFRAKLDFWFRTGPLVDDLVAELRRWFEIRQQRVDAVGDEPMRTEFLGQKMESERRMYAMLAALDEASGG